MSIQRYEASDGTRWRVRWREPSGRMRSRTFQSRRDAQGFDTDLKARRFRGEPLPRASRQTLAEAWKDWQRLVGPEKAESTRRNYEAIWRAHVARDGFDQHRLTELATDPQLIDELLALMSRRGVGLASRRKTLIVLSAVLTQCVKWKKISDNPVRHAVKVSSARQRAARPFPPIVIERIRAEIAARATKDGSGNRAAGDALLVSLLAYAGLRPQEALALRWSDIGERALIIDKAVSFGTEKATKTGANRTVPIAPPLRADLREWKRSQERPRDDAPLFPTRSGDLWSHSAWNNWRGRVWRVAVEHLAAADPSLEPLQRVRPYDCRASFVSLHLRAGASPLEVAQWAGHSPQVMFRHYAAVIEDLVGEPRVSVGKQIALARELLATRPDREVVDLVAAGMRPTSEVPPAARALLFGARKKQPQGGGT
ncbi:MAG: tyrosine-type recombinase/integrase [Steroidobacteraceae bacterium]